jgi:hypothetical protein
LLDAVPADERDGVLYALDVLTKSLTKTSKETTDA